MRRVTRKTMANAIHLAPLIAEWRGTRTPALVFGGRRGQLMTLDIFDNDLGNYNFAIIGAPGLGQVGADERDGLVLPRHRRQGLDARPRPLLREAVPQGQGHLHRVPARRRHLPQPLHATSSTSTKTSTCWCRPSPRWPRCQAAGRGPVQGHLGDGAQAVPRARQRPDGHRPARRLQGRHHRGAGRARATSASRTWPSC
jgi:hypothetical protein